MPDIRGRQSGAESCPTGNAPLAVVHAGGLGFAHAPRHTRMLSAMGRWALLFSVLCIASLGACSEWSLEREAKRAVQNYEFHELILTRLGPVHANTHERTACGTAFFKGNGGMNRASEAEYVFIYDPRGQRELESTGLRSRFNQGVLVDERTPLFTERQKRSWRDRCPVGLREK